MQKAPYLKTLLTTLLAGSLAWAAQAQFTTVDINAPAGVGSTVTNGTGSYTIIGGGTEFWGDTDQGHYAYYSQTGDFDVRVRAESLTAANRWTKAGLRLAESLDPQTEAIFVYAQPADVASTDGSGNGANFTATAWRTKRDAGNGAQGGNNETGSGFAPDFPNAWVRMSRVGDMVRTYRSGDGAAWNQIDAHDMTATTPTTRYFDHVIPSSALLGLAVSSHNQNNAFPLTTTAQFRDFGSPSNAIAISSHPANVTRVVGQTATFRASPAGGSDFAVVQWFTNGVPIPGANSISYTTPALTLAQNGLLYTMGASNVNDASVALSSAATLTVVDSPELSSATTLNNPNAIYITFSRAMNGTALNTANYTVNNGVTVSAAAFTSPASNVVKITTTTLSAGTTYQLSISAVQDLAGSAINPNPTMVNVSLGISFGTITMRRYDGSGDFTVVKDKINNCVTPQRVNRNLPTFEYGTNPANNNGGDGDTENYGAILNGIFVATVTGNHTFGFAADDNAELWLSTDANPANKVLLTSISSWGASRDFAQPGNGNEVAAQATVSLVAGNRYYMEGIFQEGGGGDHIAVAMQLPGDPAIVDGAVNLLPASYFQPSYSVDCPRAPIFVQNLGPVALTGPVNQSVVENNTATFTTVLDGSPPFTMQWYSNGVAIAGATSPTYSFSVQLPANGRVFSVVVNNLFSSATNSSTLTVIPAPQMLNAGSRLDPSGTSIYVEFSKDMGAAALVPGSYTVNNGVTVSAATFHNGNPRLVRLTVSSLTINTAYNVTGTGITDPDGNLLNPNPTTRTFTHLSGLNGPAGLTVKRFDGSSDFNNLLNKIATCVVPQRFSSNIVAMEYQTSENNDPNNGNTFADGNTDNYGVWIYGSFVPPITGNYVFGLANDDNARLYLSTDASPANKVLIINKPAWGGFRDFVLPANGNTVAPLTAGIPLVAGRRYYMEALNAEGGGGDTLSVAVQIPGGPAIIDGTQNVIPRSMFATNYSFGCPPTFFFDNLGPVAITSQPASTTVNELFPARFSVLVDGSPNYSFQWYSNNVAVPGATSPSLTFSPLRYADGASYVVVVANGFSSVTSAPAVLTVVSDVVPPVVTQILGAPSRTSIGILFSEPITALQATNPANYTITNGAGVVLAHSISVLPELAPDGKSVVLRTATQVSGGQYVLVLNNITDRAGVPNEIVPNPTVVSFTASDLFYAPGSVLFRAYPTGGGNNISELTNHPSYLNNTPDYEQIISGMNSRLASSPYNNNGRDNYGGAVLGHFIPPVSGNWVFYISSDDDGLLLMNTNGPNSSGKAPVRFAPGCCRALSGGSDPTVPISLIAGQAYFIEALFKEGGGGDYVEVAARLQGAVTPLTVIGSGNLAFASRLTITQDPTNLTVLEGQNASFNVGVSVAGAGGGSQRYQWQRSEDGTGASFTNIGGATSSSYTFRAFTVDSNIQFRVIVSLPGLQTNTSSAATLTVLRDLIPPVLLSARVGESGNQIILTYSESINPAGDISNFYFDGGVPVTCTVREVNGAIITLTFDGVIPPNTPYNLNGDGQQDEFGNTTDPFTTITPIFIYQPFGLQHRYSFRNPAGTAVGSNVLDSVGTAHGIVLGSPATFDGDRVFIGGGSSATAAYVDFPNGLLSANGAANGGGGSGRITLEGWARVTGNQNWARIVDIGNSSIGENPGPGGGGDGRDYLFLSAQEGGNTGRHVAVVREVDPLPDASTLNVETSVGYNVSNFGTEFHFVITWDESTGQVRVYEDGTLAGSFTSVAPFNKIHDVNVWLGRSQWSGDNNMQGDYNEFRIYNRIITPEEIAFNRAVGPNNAFGTPTAVRIVVQTNSMVEGSTRQAQVFADFASVSNVNLTASRTFSLVSDNPARISVSPSSLLTAGSGVSGVAHLTASFAGVSSPSVAINVTLTKLLTISQSNDVTTLSWIGGGTLQESTEVVGPWTDSANQGNPQTVPTPPGTRKFFRVRE